MVWESGLLSDQNGFWLFILNNLTLLNLKKWRKETYLDLVIRCDNNIAYSTFQSMKVYVSAFWNGCNMKLQNVTYARKVIQQLITFELISTIEMSKFIAAIRLTELCLMHHCFKYTIYLLIYRFGLHVLVFNDYGSIYDPTFTATRSQVALSNTLLTANSQVFKPFESPVALKCLQVYIRKTNE